MITTMRQMLTELISQDSYDLLLMKMKLYILKEEIKVAESIIRDECTCPDLFIKTNMQKSYLGLDEVEKEWDECIICGKRHNTVYRRNDEKT